MQQQDSDIPFGQEITDINREFLGLLTSGPECGVEQVLGLDGGAVTALQRLGEEQLERIARAPLLLAEFSPFPGFCEIREIVTRSYPAVQQGWQQQLKGFADRLLACIWQTAKHDKLTMSLYTGIASDRCRRLSDMSFCHLSRYSDLAVHTLRVRLGDHPGFWPDLIRSVQQGDRTRRVVSRMSAIQLSVAKEWLDKGRIKDTRYI